MKFLLVILFVFFDVSNSQDEVTTLATNNPCESSPCGNGICHVDYENR